MYGTLPFRDFLYHRWLLSGMWQLYFLSWWIFTTQTPNLKFTHVTSSPSLLTSIQSLSAINSPQIFMESILLKFTKFLSPRPHPFLPKLGEHALKWPFCFGFALLLLQYPSVYPLSQKRQSNNNLRYKSQWLMTSLLYSKFLNYIQDNFRTSLGDPEGLGAGHCQYFQLHLLLLTPSPPFTLFLWNFCNHRVSCPENRLLLLHRIITSPICKLELNF